jgi:glycosyltransferase involved in cell wall biosynthesis
MSKKILIVSRYFWPDKTPESLILKSLAKFLASKGHEVDVLSSFPSYRRDHSELNIKKTEITNGFRVVRLKLQNEIGKSFFFRIINALKLGLKTIFLAINKKYEIIIATSNPPIIGPFIASFCALLINSRFIYYCMDITPEVGKISGDFKNPLLFNLLKLIDTLSCLSAQPLIVHSKDMKNTFLKRQLGSKFKFKILNNFSVESNNQNFIHEKLNVYDDEKKLRVIYAGNIGRFQGLENSIYSMSKIKNHKDIELIIMGEGIRKEYLIQLAKELKSNVKLIPYQNYELAQKYIEQADLGLISLSSGVYKYAYPSKTMAYLEQGKPIIAMVEEKSEIAKEIVKGGYGYVLSNKESLSDLLLYLKSNPDELKIKSLSAYEKYKNSFSASVILEKWNKIIDHENIFI